MATSRFSVSTSASREVIDITRQVQEAVAGTSVTSGIACISVAHCTCAVYVNEHERGLLDDVLQLADELTGGRDWRHDRIDDNACAHLAAVVIGNSVTLPVVDGQVELGTWQRILLVELDGPRRRNVRVSVVGEE